MTTDTAESAQGIAAKAQGLMQRFTKRELSRLARSHGWRGDDARTPMLQIALYCAAKGVTPENSESHDTNPDAQGTRGRSESEARDDGQGESGEQSSGDSDPQDAAQEQSDQGEQSQGDGADGEQSKGDGADSDKASDGKDAKGKGKQSDKKDGKKKDGKPEQGKGDGQGDEQQDEQPPEVEQPRAPNNKEWQAMLQGAGIDRPHPMLRKVHALAVIAKVHVLLIGPAGCGKTMLAKQLAQLLGYTFGLNSMTAGTSESALTGWLLPVGEAGKFEYVPAPFVNNFEQGKSVHLLDEADASDANLLLVLNAALANGYFPVPHNLKKPVVQRHETHITMAAANTMGNGADDLYTGRTALDASTLDRLYMVKIDYATDYEAALFGIEVPDSKGWTPCKDKPTAELLKQAHAWIVDLRAKVHNLKIPRIVSTRMFQKVRAALDAGLSLKEIKGDLLMAYSPDELRRIGEQA